MELPAGLPDHLRPRLLLFLSADVVGSTALKQPDRDKARSAESDAQDVARASPDRRLEVNWLVIFETFYARIGHRGRKHWNDLIAECKNQEELERYAGECPAFWKTNGDEVLYCKLLTDSRQIHLAIEWWKRTIHSARKGLDKFSGILREAGLEPLDVKATAWTAGFPRRNKRIESAYGLEIALDDQTAAEPPESGAKGQKSPDAPKDRFDFIGPGIDIGFRISALSSTQKMVVSLDVAYILARAQFRVGTGVRREGIYYDGRTLLKGVFDGNRYPIFWLDISRQGSFDQQEVAILNPLLPDNVAEICAQYYERYSDYTHAPFIWNDPSQVISEVDQKFIDWLERANHEYQRQVATQARVSAIAEPSEEMGVASRRKVVSEVVNELAKKAKSISDKAGGEGGEGSAGG